MKIRCLDRILVLKILQKYTNNRIIKVHRKILADYHCQTNTKSAKINHQLITLIILSIATAIIQTIPLLKTTIKIVYLPIQVKNTKNKHKKAAKVVIKVQQEHHNLYKIIKQLYINLIYKINNQNKVWLIWFVTYLACLIVRCQIQLYLDGRGRKLIRLNLGKINKILRNRIKE